MKKASSPKGPVTWIRSGGGRMALYEELGQYFTPDGAFMEDRFRRQFEMSLREHLGAKGSRETASWLSGHLAEIVDYLDERDLGAQTVRLLEVAMEVAENLQLDQLNLPPALLRRVLQAGANASGPAGQRRREPDEKRVRIFAAALEIFSERGFHGATMDQVAERAGVAKGTVYRYFASKEELLRELFREAARELAEQFRISFGRDGDLVEMVESFITAWLDFIERNPTLYRILQTEGAYLGGEGGAVFYEELIEAFPMAKERLAALNRSGALKTMNFHTLAFGVLGFMDGVARKWFRAGMSYPLRDELPIILETLFNGIVLEGSHRKHFIPESGA
ncbi:MAG TPA: TetR/AcrR family transcriptional regulator [Candidatus Hydrogenedentes bacterium]|nr:TetR/AcrR family transcriptional regulator [Candidatus Hydrogenedentota bacterium]